MKKRCTRCKRIREVKFFGIDRGRGDGLQNKCMECVRAYNKEYRERNKAKYAKKEARPS